MARIICNLQEPFDFVTRKRGPGLLQQQQPILAFIDPFGNVSYVDDGVGGSAHFEESNRDEDPEENFARSGPEGIDGP